MSLRITVCPIDDLPPGQSVVASTGASTIAVFNLDGELLAIDNACAHKQQPLAEGVVRDGIVTCPAHLWRYDIRTGERIDAPGWAVGCHPVSIVDGTIVVEVPEPAPARSMREQLLDHAKEWRRDA